MENSTNNIGISEHNAANILKELSDIKSSLAVNTNETNNIKSNLIEIKVDIKEIKNDFVNRRELTEAAQAVRAETDARVAAISGDVSTLKRVVYGALSILGTAFLGALIKIVFIN